MATEGRCARAGWMMGMPAGRTMGIEAFERIRTGVTET
jgi:hypothetical protein